MVIYIEPREDFQKDEVSFFQGTEYRAIITDVWECSRNTGDDILGMTITGGHLSRREYACTRDELFNKFIINKETL